MHASEVFEDPKTTSCAFDGRRATALCTRCATPYCPQDGDRLCDACIAEQIPLAEYGQGGLLYPYGAEAFTLGGLEHLKAARKDIHLRLNLNMLAIIAAVLMAAAPLPGLLILPWPWLLLPLGAAGFAVLLAVVFVVVRAPLVAVQNDMDRRTRAVRAKYADVALENRRVARQRIVPHLTPSMVD